MQVQFLIALFTMAMMVVGMAHGQDAKPKPSPSDEETPTGYWNWSIKTLGGRQFWTDVRHLDGWRIQRNHVTGHFRLLDPANVRHAWGNLTHCYGQMDVIAEAKNLQPHRGKVVVLLHGLVRSHASMLPLAVHLEDAGFSGFEFSICEWSRKHQ